MLRSILATDDQDVAVGQDDGRRMAWLRHCWTGVDDPVAGSKISMLATLLG